jgi:predicted branched-subunit amino acid permease
VTAVARSDAPTGDPGDAGDRWPERRRQVMRDALGVGLATGAYALSYGALATTAGLSVAQTCALSLLMFTGGSQFALIGVAAGGGSPVSGASTAVLLGARNAFYGLRLTSLLDVRGARKLVAAQLVIDESSAMAVGQDDDPRAARVAFWSTGIAVYVFWNLVTLVGALGAETLSDPGVLGLDAAAPAAFLALIAPRVREREPFAIALASALVALAVTPLVAPGVPVLAAAAVAVVAGLLLGQGPVVATAAPAEAAADASADDGADDGGGGGGEDEATDPKDGR